jgi:hypothetical protein
MSVEIEQVNGLVLRRQHLTEDSKAEGLAGMVKDICGLHATGATTPYVSSFLRLKGFEKEDLDEALYAKKSLGRLRCMRCTMYIQPTEDFPAYYSALGGILWQESESRLRHIGISVEEYNGLREAILSLLSGKGMTAQEIKKALGKEASLFLVLTMMCDSGLLVRGPPKGSWKSNLHTYHLLSEYYPGVGMKIDPGQATASLVLRYLKAFGPASEDDIAWWTGLRRTAILETLEGLGGRISHVDVAGLKKGLVIAAADLRPLRDARPPGPMVRLLPSLDPYLMGYKGRDRYLAPEFYGYVYDRSGNATTAILIDGRLAGVWEAEQGKNTVVKYFLFEEEDTAAIKEIRLQATAMGGFLAGRPVLVQERDSMVPLARRPPGAVMSPLRSDL